MTGVRITIEKIDRFADRYRAHIDIEEDGILNPFFQAFVSSSVYEAAKSFLERNGFKEDWYNYDGCTFIKEGKL